MVVSKKESTFYRWRRSRIVRNAFANHLYQYICKRNRETENECSSDHVAPGNNGIEYHGWNCGGTVKIWCNELVNGKLIYKNRSNNKAVRQ